MGGSTVPVKITGLGFLNALGLGKPTYWQRLLSGSCGIGPISRFQALSGGKGFGAEISTFDPKIYMAPRFYRRLSRLSRLAVAASIEAVKDCGLEISDGNRSRVGAIFGTAFGSTEQADSFFLTLLEQGPQGAEPILFPDTVPNAPASHVSMYHQIRGPNSTFCQNHLSGECALAFAISLLEQERADALLVGGVDELSQILFHSLDAVGALKLDDPPLQAVPGKGFILGEGATCLVLERGDMMRQNAPSPYGKLLALSHACARTAQGHFEEDGKAMTDAITAALEEAKLLPADIDVIGSAVNGSEELEGAESKALERVFGMQWHHIPRVPLRYFVGEFGSAGLLTIATLLMAIREGVIPPYIQGSNLSVSRGDSRRLRPAKEAALRVGMAIGSTFGGESSCAIIGREEGP